MVSISHATPSDVPIIVDLLEEVERFYGTTEFPPREERAEDVHSALFGQQPSAFMILATRDEKPVGLAAYSFLWPAAGTSRSLFLKELFVTESSRGSGTGRALMRAVFDTAAQTRCSRVEWQTDTDNPISQRFYADLGVEPQPGKIFYRVPTDRAADLAH